MSKKIIAVDVDDVLAANAQGFIEFSNRQWGGDLTVEDFQEDFSQMWGVSNEEVTKRMNEYAELGIAADYAYFKDSVSTVERLSQKYDLIVVTSRRSLLKDLTKTWLDKHFGGVFKEVRHSGFFDNLEDRSYHETKAEICKEIGADYLIDDQPKHCFAVAEAGIQALLFGDYIWNKKIKELPPRVTRVANWQKVEEYFNGQDSQ